MRLGGVEGEERKVEYDEYLRAATSCSHSDMIKRLYEITRDVSIWDPESRTAQESIKDEGDSSEGPRSGRWSENKERLAHCIWLTPDPAECLRSWSCERTLHRNYIITRQCIMPISHVLLDHSY